MPCNPDPEAIQTHTSITAPPHQLTVYPIKAIRGISLNAATLTPQGIVHDRSFMLLKVDDDGSLQKMQLGSFPACALFEQRVVDVHGNEISLEDVSPDAGPADASILVRYHAPNPPLAMEHPLQREALSVPLRPCTASLEPIEVDLHNSRARARRMGDPFDAWFTACFGFPVILVHIGEGRREVLGSFSPKKAQREQGSLVFSNLACLLGGWLLWLLSLLSGYRLFKTDVSPKLSNGKAMPDSEDDWLTFSDCSPFLITSESSLEAVSARFSPENPVPMLKFRPNLVVDGEPRWDEDFWAELALVRSQRKLLLTANCVRCSSLNVDYATGRKAQGEPGSVLQRLMKDRRVDSGSKWSPVFGRYAFLEGDDCVTVRVGEELDVVRRNQDRTVHDWPLKPKSPPLKINQT